MAREFAIPEFYRSSIISKIKQQRRIEDPLKKDRGPSLIDLGPIRFKIARHFGFCFGVENAIDIAYRALEENPDKRVFLLSEMIHNPHVNADLQRRGIRFILAPDGEQLIPFEELKPEDIVIVPAFGTTRELIDKLNSIGIDPSFYNATCPFVEKVWKRARALGENGYSIIIHGKHSHEETRATFSHARISSPSLIIRDLKEARQLASYMRGERGDVDFEAEFAGRFSEGFCASKDLVKFGIVNQTTMLASETQEISEYLKEVMLEIYPDDPIEYHFADTRDTLCYATNENQSATLKLIDSGGDLAIVVGGYNSSNTSHLVELCEKHAPTYYIKDADEILSKDEIQHLSLEEHKVVKSSAWLDIKRDPLTVLVTAGASCPDALVDQVLVKIASFYQLSDRLNDIVSGISA